jgi:hypothetical protein
MWTRGGQLEERARLVARLAFVSVMGIALGFVSPLRLQCEFPDFSDDFSYSNGTFLDGLDNWQATPGPSGPVVINGQVLIDGSQSHSFLRATETVASVEQPLWWPLERVARRFTQVEFDLVANVAVGDPAGDEGRLSVYFTPDPNDGDTLDSASTPGPAAAIDLVCDQKLGRVTARLELRAKTPEVPGNPGTVEPVSVPNFTLPDFGTSPRRFRLEFGWDWYVNPGRHDAITHQDQIGRPFLFARVRYSDDGGVTWRNPMVEQSEPVNPRPDPDPDPSVDRNFDGTGGWIVFGSDPRWGYNQFGLADVQKTGADWRDWKARSADPNCPSLYPYLVAERIGTAGEVDWTLDNFALRAPVPDPITLFVNALGYDIAATQWALIRPNRIEFRDETSMEGMQFGSVELRDGSGMVVRSLLMGNLSITPARPCFRELDDMETWPFPDSNFLQVHWRRIDWNRITEPRNDCYLRVVVTPPGSSQPFTIESHRFAVGEELWWQATLPTVGFANELSRRNSLWGYPEGGWSDAGNDNAENHAHGLFVSGFAHVLRERRGELTTAEMKTLIEAMKFGAEWIRELVGENSDPDANLRRQDHRVLAQACGYVDAEHYFDDQDQYQEDDQGHIWHEHHSRPHGGAIKHLPGVDDAGNPVESIFTTADGLIDVAWTLLPFDSQAAATYREQAEKCREYLYWIENPKCTLPPDGILTYRLQAPLDVLFEDAGSSLPANMNHPAGDGPPPPVANNVELARDKLLQDLTTFPIDTTTTNYRQWMATSHGVNAPQAAPWVGLLQMHERGQSGANWKDLLAILADRYYVVDVHKNGLSTNPPNVLHSPRVWAATNVTHKDYKGTYQRPCTLAPYEVYSIARLAMALGPSDPSYADLRLLVIGGINWLMGIHYGVRGRYVLPPSDRGIAACDQVGQEVPARRGVLRRPLPGAKHVLLPVGRDADGDQDHVLREVDAVDHEDQEIDPIERALEEGLKLLLRGDHEAPAHGTLARAADRDRRWDRFQRAAVLARAHPDHHLLKCTSIERILVREALPRGQQDLAAVQRPRTRTPHGDPSASQRQLSRVVSMRNWILIGNVRGGKGAAVLFSLVQTCKAIGIDPKTYLRDVLERIAKESEVTKLTPHGWKQHFAPEVAAQRDSLLAAAVAAS